VAKTDHGVGDDGTREMVRTDYDYESTRPTTDLIDSDNRRRKSAIIRRLTCADLPDVMPSCGKIRLGLGASRRRQLPKKAYTGQKPLPTGSEGVSRILDRVKPPRTQAP